MSTLDTLGIEEVGPGTAEPRSHAVGTCACGPETGTNASRQPTANPRLIAAEGELIRAAGRRRSAILQHPDVINDLPPDDIALSHALSGALFDPLFEIDLSLDDDIMPDSALAERLISGQSKTETQVANLTDAIRDLKGEIKASMSELADRVNADYDAMRVEIRGIPVMQSEIAATKAQVSELKVKLEGLMEDKWFRHGVAAAVGFAASLLAKFLFK